MSLVDEQYIFGIKVNGYYQLITKLPIFPESIRL